MIQNQIQGKESLSEQASIHLFARHFNQIDAAIESCTDEPELQQELQKFKTLNQAYYDEAKEYFEKNVELLENIK